MKYDRKIADISGQATNSQQQLIQNPITRTKRHRAFFLNNRIS